ncbi:MAG: penicillin-insensitive murein endopeptidase [Nannocystaceae bacterium]
MSRPSTQETFIAAGTHVHGAVECGDVRVHGRVSGAIYAEGEIEVAGGGRVTGTLESASLRVAGLVLGRVRVRGQVRLDPGGICEAEVACSHPCEHQRAGRLPAPQLTAPQLPAPQLTAPQPLEVPHAAARAQAQAHRSTPRRLDPRAAHPPARSRRGLGVVIAVAATAALAVPTSFTVASEIPDVIPYALQLDHEPLPTLTAWVVVPDEPLLPVMRTPRLDDIHWGARISGSLRAQAVRWGVRLEELATLNPSIAPKLRLERGTPIRVHHAATNQRGMSIGAPNRGRLVDGVPMPEGEYWKLRGFRSRVYGTQQTVHHLVRALTEYGRRFPDAAPVRLGDLSAKHGQLLPPHKSHQTGRDVDIFYVRTRRTQGRHARPTFDARRNWFLVKRLVDTGRVQTIFMAQRWRRVIREAAQADVPQDRVRHYLRFISGDSDHRRHMHVRFTCDGENPRCRAHSIVDRSKPPQG